MMVPGLQAEAQAANNWSLEQMLIAGNELWPPGEGLARAAPGSLPHARVPSGAPTHWPPPPPPPPPHAPPLPPQSQRGATLSGGEDPVVSQELLAAVRRRVAGLLAVATRESEMKVATEIRRLEAALAQMSEKVRKIKAALRERDMNRDALEGMINEIDRRWDQEVQVLKQQLHHTILAHNHNADLMADHRSSIDEISSRLEEWGAGTSRQGLEQQCRQQIHLLSLTLERHQARDREVDAFLHQAEYLMHHAATMGFGPAFPMGGASLLMPPYVAGTM